MKNLDLHYICTLVGNLCSIPIRLFEKESLLFYYFLADLPKDPMYLYETEIFAVRGSIGYFITPQFNYYGIVNSGDIKIVLGPTRQISDNEQELRHLAFTADVPSDQTDDFIAGMKNIVRMPLDSIMQILCTINYILNGEKRNLEDISILDYEQTDLQKDLELRHAQELFSDEQDSITLQQDIHNTLALEQELTDIVRKGDTAALKEWIASAPAIRGGILASDQLRQVKNTFIVSATLASRAAIRGGMDANDALTVSDAFIQKCELLPDLNRISNLQYHMILYYTEHVELIRIGRHPSKLITDTANYVHHHLSEALTAEKIAAHLYVSRPYLSAKFKEETGENLTDFILKTKTKEAGRLLTYTDKPLLAISDYLGFSSQAHFSRVFKKYAGCTPREYRDIIR